MKYYEQKGHFCDSLYDFQFITGIWTQQVVLIDSSAVLCTLKCLSRNGNALVKNTSK